MDNQQNNSSPQSMNNNTDGLMPPAIERLSAELAKLPSIGPKTAQRLTFYCMSASKNFAEALAEALKQLHQQVKTCRQCFFFSETDLCAVCKNPRRDITQICVVEEAMDVLTIERSGEFKGFYHVLQGAISPIEGVGPDELRISELLTRLKGSAVKEVILATDPDVEGEATAYYLSQAISALGISVSKLAHGLPAGADLQYSDELTVARAFVGRRSI